jgi:hypothetical protein
VDTECRAIARALALARPPLGLPPATLVSRLAPASHAGRRKEKSVDHYHIFCDLKPGVSDVDFAERTAKYMAHLQALGLIAAYRLTRRKLGLGIRELGEFHIDIEVKDLAQLERAFEHVAGRREPVEGLHVDVNSLVQNARFALYRDFPDPFRHRGEERF